MNRDFLTPPKTLIAACAILLTACGPAPLKPSSGPDQCLRREIFQQCMASLPAGSTATKYNDWDEVVSACDNAARDQSWRKIEHIKPECRQ